MKRILVLAVAILLTGSAFSAIPMEKPAAPMITLANGIQVSADQFMTMTPHEYRQLTGKKMGFFKSIGLKAAQKQMRKAAAGKSQLTALLLCLFLGGLGIHRFYLGYTWQGVVQLLTLGGLGVWALIDLIRIIIGDLKPKDGEYETTL